MTTTATRQRSETAEQILDLAETLIQTRGYSAFSYQDIADALGIRKASIHYHFPSKADLGVAVINRYIDRFDAALTEVAGDESQSSMAMLELYVQPYLQFARAPDRVCLCGALAGEMLALPLNYEAQVRPRSGLAAKFGVTVLNAPGTIDADYRGEINVLLINHGSAPFTIQRGERIAQMVIAPVVQAQLVPAFGSLSATVRGSGGFGSTGR